MRQYPTWLPLAHIVSFVLAWALCVWLGLTFGAWVGWLTFAVMEFRAVTARMVDTTYGHDGGAL